MGDQPAPSGPRILTHPADWEMAGPRCQTLLAGAARAGMREVELISEPEAVAWYLTDSLDAGETFAVFDLGGGTCDMAVLRRRERGFELLARPRAELIGGELADTLVLELVMERLADRDPAAANALHEAERVRAGGHLASIDADVLLWQRCLGDTENGVRTAKARLSTLESTRLSLPPPAPRGTKIDITRVDLEDRICPHLDRAADTLGALLEEAGLDPATTPVMLSGAASVMPIVKRRLQDRIGAPIRPVSPPKGAVALGALRAIEARQDTATLSTAGPPRTKEPESVTLQQSGPGREPVEISPELTLRRIHEIHLKRCSRSVLVEDRGAIVQVSTTTVNCFDLSDGSERWGQELTSGTFRSPEGWSIATSPDEVAAGTSTGAIEVFAIESGERTGIGDQLPVFPNFRNLEVTALCFLGRRAETLWVRGRWDGTVTTILPGGEEERVLHRHSEPVRDLALEPESGTVASLTRHGLAFSSPAGPVRVIAAADDDEFFSLSVGGGSFAAGTDRGSVYFFSPLGDNIGGLSTGREYVRVALSPAGDVLAVGDQQGRVTVHTPDGHADLGTVERGLVPGQGALSVGKRHVVASGARLVVWRSAR